jgi:2'-5' RNA ligase
VLHVTLRHVGDVVGPPREMVEALTAALAEVELPAFEVTFDAVTRFVGSRAFVLLASEDANGGLIEFHKALCARLDGAGAGWRVGGGAFTPHLTLSYEDREVRVRPIEPLTWTAREFVLTHSLIGQTRHVSLARVPLA